MLVPIMVVTAAAAACGGGDDAGFITDQFASIPAGAAGDPVQIVVTDLDRLSGLRGEAGPDAARTGDELAAWTGEMTFGALQANGSTLIGFLPNPLGSVASWSSADEVRAATGIALGGVETIVTVDSPPNAFTVMSGDIELSDALTDLGDGVVSYGDGDDLSIGEPTSWNQIGAPVRFATRDGAIAWSRTTDLAAEFAAGADRTLADDPAFGALAGALDGYGVVSALVARDDFTAPAGTQTPDVPPFAAVAVGATLIEDEARTIVAYAFADDDAAAGALDALTAAWSEGNDAEGRPIGEQFAVLSSATDGTVAVIELVPVGLESTQGPGRLLLTRAPVFMHP